MQKLNKRNFFQKNTHICNHYVTQIRKHYLSRFEGWHEYGTILCHGSKCLKINVFKGKRHFDIVGVTGSIPATPTKKKPPLRRLFFVLTTGLNQTMPFAANKRRRGFPQLKVNSMSLIFLTKSNFGFMRLYIKTLLLT